MWVHFPASVTAVCEDTDGSRVLAFLFESILRSLVQVLDDHVHDYGPRLAHANTGIALLVVSLQHLVLQTDKFLEHLDSLSVVFSVLE